MKVLVSSLVSFFCIVGCAHKGKIEILPGFAVMQGGTDSVSTQISVLHRKNQSLNFLIKNTSSNRDLKLKPQSIQKKMRENSSWQLTQIDLDGLSSASRYRIDFRDPHGKIIDSREFKTLESTPQLKWALASCMNDSFMNAQKQQWLDLLSHRPQALFMIGDNVYVDLKTKNITPSVLWERYAETRNRLEVFRSKKLTPVFATWDDHDFGKNNGGKEFNYAKEAREVFEDFFPQKTNKFIFSKGPGLARAFRFSRQTFLLLDNRSFRSLRNISDKKQSHFGAEQEHWIDKIIKQAKGPVWLISGDQFFGGYHKFESYQGNHPAAFRRFLRRLKRTGKVVVFVSGDRHLTELMRIPKKHLGYTTYELTSSGVHSSVFPGSLKRNPNPLDIEAQDGTMNYMVIESQGKAKGLRFKSTSYGPDKKILFSRRLKIDN